MNMFEEAEALVTMMKMCSASQSEMAKRLGVSQSYVANKIRLLNLDSCERKMISDAALSERHARALLRIREKEKREGAIKAVIERHLTVSETEALADYLHADELPRRLAGVPRGERIASFNNTLSECLTILKSAGVNAYKTVGFHGTKTYITIAIDET